MNCKLLPILLVVLLLSLTGFAQSKQENLLEETNLQFFLEGEPTPQDVGFDNPKSYWKVNYELYLTDFSEMEKLGLVKTENGLKYIAPIVQNKRNNKRIKKKSTKILKGNFTKKSLLSEANREVIIPVNLPPDVIQIYNQAAEIPEKNPTFVLFIAEKIFVKNSAKTKLKYKYFLTDFSSLKHSGSNKTGEYWNVKIMSLRVKIYKTNDGKLKFVGSYIHNW